MINKKSTYNRFNKIFEKILKNYPKESFLDKDFVARSFNTNLGTRAITMTRIKDDLFFNYLDFDYSKLFSLKINTKGKITILNSKINQLAIFSAIYEIENILYNEDKEECNFLEKLFESTNKDFKLFSFTQYR